VLLNWWRSTGLIQVRPSPHTPSSDRHDQRRGSKTGSWADRHSDAGCETAPHLGADWVGEPVDIPRLLNFSSPLLEQVFEYI